MSDPIKRDSAKKAFRVFEEGKKFAEDLINENEKLRVVNTNLNIELRNLESQYVKLDVVRLQKKLESLETQLLALREENKELKSHFLTVEEVNRNFTERYMIVEKQNSDLLNLYVCMYRLHSTIDYNEVIQTIKEIVISLLGSECFGIYMLDDKTGNFRVVGYEGVDESVLKKVSLTDGIVGNTITSGQLYVAQETAIPKLPDNIIACIPLKIGDRILGVLLIFQLVMHKEVFKPIDFELFEILGAHAATAISVSKMFSGHR